MLFRKLAPALVLTVTALGCSRPAIMFADQQQEQPSQARHAPVHDNYGFCREGVIESYNWQVNNRAVLEKPTLHALKNLIKARQHNDAAAVKKAGAYVRYRYNKMIKTLTIMDVVYGEFACQIKATGEIISNQKLRDMGDLPLIRKTVADDPDVPAAL